MLITHVLRYSMYKVKLNDICTYVFTVHSSFLRFQRQLFYCFAPTLLVERRQYKAFSAAHSENLSRIRNGPHGVLRARENWIMKKLKVENLVSGLAGNVAQHNISLKTKKYNCGLILVNLRMLKKQHRWSSHSDGSNQKGETFYNITSNTAEYGLPPPHPF